MPATPKLNITYPSKDSRTWYDKFVSFADSVDLGLYSRIEDSNAIVSGGGDFTWNSSTGELSWSEQINILSPVVGYNWYIAASDLTILDGQIAYVTLTRAPSANTAVTLTAGSNLSAINSNLGYILFHRRGTALYCRNGRVMENGDAFPLLEQSSDAAGVGTSGQKIVHNITMATNETITTSTPTVIGAYYFNPAVYTLEGTTTTIRFKFVASITNEDAGLTVELHDLTGSTLITGQEITALTPAEYLSGDMVSTISAAGRMYEVRHYLQNNVPGDSGTCWWAGFEITQTID